MLIKLLPEPPHPSVLFNITFEDLPDGMILPPAWTAHLSNLMHDELTIPRCQHALDKAAFLPSILEEVVFDLPSMSIICRFIDGSIEQWRIDSEGSDRRLGRKCLKTLESVVDDVCLSTVESERERQRERRREREREREREKERERLRLLQQVSFSPTTSSIKRHKKKRSLLMTIVSSLSSLNSIINLSLPSPTIPLPSSALHPSPQIAPPPSPPKSPTNISPRRTTSPPTEPLCPRSLRRRARSSLVDAFRLHVLRELIQRVPQGGYYVWILHSLLKEARERRDAIFASERERERERMSLMDTPPPFRTSTSSSASSNSNSSRSGGLLSFGRRRHSPDLLRPHSSGSSVEVEQFSATTASEPILSDDEDDQDQRRMGIEEVRETDADTETVETETTDTDGSTVHTPSSSHSALPLPTPPTPPSSSFPYLPSPYDPEPSAISQSPQPSSPPTDPTELQIQTFTHLILLHTSHAARNAHDESTRLDALEVRGRRRAWLNRALCPNGLRLTSLPGEHVSAHAQRMEISTGAGLGGLGFAVPLRRSSLGMWVINAEDLELQEEQGEGGQVLDIRRQDGGGQLNAIMVEEEDMRSPGTERYTGHDERNGIEPRRFKVPVPSRRAQLFPVNEVDEDEIMGAAAAQQQNAGTGVLSGNGNDDEDDTTLHFANLDLNQYDDLRELQMDLDIVTGVGFDMDSSDEEEGDSHVDGKSTEGNIPEGGICVALDIPKPKTLHARSLHLLSGHEQRQRQRQRQAASGVLNQDHSVHQYPHPTIVVSSFEHRYAQDLHIPQRCTTPLPQYPPPGLPQPSLLPTSNPSSITASIPVLQPAYLRARSPPSQPPSTVSDSLSSRTSTSDPTEATLHPSATAAAQGPLASGICAPAASECKPFLSNEVHVNEIGELVATLGMAREEGEEFTLAMDLPSKSLSSRFGNMSFAAMGRTKNFRGRVRGASRIRGEEEEVECRWV